MDSKHIKTCSTSLTIREMQIKTTVSYHFTPLRISIIKKMNNDIHMDVKKLEPPTLL